jgi:hypothetical protein
MVAWYTYLFAPAQLPNQRARDRTPPRQFSTLIKTMVVELDRDPALYSDSNIVEVSANNADLTIT